MVHKNHHKREFQKPRLAFKLGVLAGVFLLFEAGAWMVFKTNWRDFETTRELMAGEVTPSTAFQRCIAQPYLLYVPTPEYSDQHGLQHNSQGYRGQAFPLKKKPGVVRILCMGGSTTYGWGVPQGNQTYSAYLQEFLSANLPAGVKGVEVINAGIPGGTTAEILTHYHFKFHYYKPDLVILNPGGNDARTLYVPYYHPDYSHTRKQMVLPRPLPPLGRHLMKSRLLSLMIIPLLHGTYPSAEPFYTYEGRPPAVPWYSPTLQSKKNVSIPIEDVAFKHNLEMVLDEIKKDGAKVLLVPFRSSPVIQYWPREGLVLEENILGELARKRNLGLAPYPATVVSKQNWVDDCHINAAGHKEKAAYLLPYVRQLLWNKS